MLGFLYLNLFDLFFIGRLKVEWSVVLLMFIVVFFVEVVSNIVGWLGLCVGVCKVFVIFLYIVLIKWDLFLFFFLFRKIWNGLGIFIDNFIVVV